MNVSQESEISCISELIKEANCKIRLLNV